MGLTTQEAAISAQRARSGGQARKSARSCGVTGTPAAAGARRLLESEEGNEGVLSSSPKWDPWSLQFGCARVTCASHGKTETSWRPALRFAVKRRGHGQLRERARRAAVTHRGPRRAQGRGRLSGSTTRMRPLGYKGGWKEGRFLPPTQETAAGYPVDPWNQHWLPRQSHCVF